MKISKFFGIHPDHMFSSNQAFEAITWRYDNFLEILRK